jgi:hypothetical protein
MSDTHAADVQVPVFTPGQRPPQPAAQQTQGNSLVQVTDWQASYVGQQQFQIAAVVAPANASDSLTVVTSTAQVLNSPTIIAATTLVTFGGSGAGHSLSTFAYSNLYDPAQHGTTIFANVSGFVSTAGGTQPFYISQQLPVSGA